jgi:MFS family permease
MTLSLTWIIFLTPAMLVRLFGGVYIDRWNKRKTIIFVDFFEGVIFAGIALVFFAGLLEAWMVYVTSLLIGCFLTLLSLASEAILPSLIQKEEIMSANSILQTISQVLRVASPAVAGFYIALFGTVSALMFNGITSFIAVIVWVLLRASETGITRTRGSWKEDFKEGLRYFSERRVLIWLAVFISIINFSLAPLMYVYLLVFAREILKAGAEGFGLLQSSLSLGFILGAAVVGFLGGISKRRESILSSVFTVGLSTVLFSFSSNILFALLLIGLLGFAVPFTNILISTIYQETVPKDLRGRVFSVRLVIGQGSLPLGVFFGGLLSIWFSVQQTVLLLGFIIVLFATVGIFISPLKKLNQL